MEHHRFGRLGDEVMRSVRRFVRSVEQLDRAKAAAGQKWVSLTEHPDGTSDRVAVGEMHFAKSLEARAVAVIACDNEVITLQARVRLPSVSGGSRSRPAPGLR
jgi:superfamily I DNA/RNA helicase